MANPFEKRVTEYLRDDAAFLAMVTPEPLATFFQEYAKDGRLYDRLAMVIGTPGSGKTTIARLFQFTTLCTLLGSRHRTNRNPLIDTLTLCGAIQDYRPALIGARLPLEAEYRDIWEFSYPDRIKEALMTKLLQARAVLTWLQSVQTTGVPLEQVEIVPSADANAALTAIGGTSGPSLLSRARTVEHAIYGISAALLPPDLEDIDRDATTAYRPFDVIDAFRIRYQEETVDVRPLVIFDDAHSLHRDQFGALRRWLLRREIKVSRWILTRLDALNPQDVLLGRDTDGESSTLKPSREITPILMQSDRDRIKQRRAFRAMAKDMAGRYLRQMDVFSRRGLHNLGELLATTSVHLSTSTRKRLRKHVEIVQRRTGVSDERRETLDKLIDDYFVNTGQEGEDLRLAIFLVLCERYARRAPQPSLFDDSEDREPKQPLKVDAGVVDGARIQLLHNYGLPYFVGIDTLCDASSENAEQFLQLAKQLVSRLETQIIRGRRPVLSGREQHDLLRIGAKQMIDEWNFPQRQVVRRLADGIARECVTKSLEGNASLNGGATAFGILQDEFDNIPYEFPDLAQALQYGVAYNAFVLVHDYRTKGHIWCLIELGGVLRLHHQLTLKRGGFLERSTRDLTRLLGNA